MPTSSWRSRWMKRASDSRTRLGLGCAHRSWWPRSATPWDSAGARITRSSANHCGSMASSTVGTGTWLVRAPSWRCSGATGARRCRWRAARLTRARSPVRRRSCSRSRRAGPAMRASRRPPRRGPPISSRGCPRRTTSRACGRGAMAAARKPVARSRPPLRSTRVGATLCSRSPGCACQAWSRIRCRRGSSLAAARVANSHRPSAPSRRSTSSSTLCPSWHSAPRRSRPTRCARSCT